MSAFGASHGDGRQAAPIAPPPSTPALMVRCVGGPSLPASPSPHGSGSSSKPPEAKRQGEIEQVEAAWLLAPS